MNQPACCPRECAGCQTGGAGCFPLGSEGASRSLGLHLSRDCAWNKMWLRCGGSVVKQWGGSGRAGCVAWLPCAAVRDFVSLLSTPLINCMEREKKKILEKVSDAVTCLFSSSWKIIERGSLKMRLCLLSRLSESIFPCFFSLLGSASLVLGLP